MSYIRSGWAYVYVDGISDDYIFGAGDEIGIVDYGGPSDNTLVEFINELLLEPDYRKDDIEFRKYVIKNIASRLGVKLRETPLSPDDQWKLFQTELDKFNVTE